MKKTSKRWKLFTFLRKKDAKSKSAREEMSRIIEEFSAKEEALGFPLHLPAKFVCYLDEIEKRIEKLEEAQVIGEH